MGLKMIVAIIRTQALERLEVRFVEMGIHGFSVSKVKECGEYANFFNSD